MKSAIRRILVLAAVSFGWATSAQAQNTYDGMWWDSSRSGMGVQISHQGTGAFVTWFAYDTSGNPIWYALSGTVDSSTISGTLYSYRSSPFTSNYTPSGVTATAAGTATLTFTSGNAGSLSYAIGSSTGTLTLARFAVALPDASGSYLGGGWVQSGTCGLDTYSATYSIAQSGSALTVTEVSDGGEVCTFNGVVTQLGAKLSLSGSFSCNTGSAGTVGSNEIWVTPRSFTFAGALTYTAPTACTANAVIGGLK